MVDAWDVVAAPIEMSAARTRAAADFAVIFTEVLLSQLTDSLSAIL
jgi:hypothetical protein